MNKFFINLSRVLIAGLIIFELLNQFKILNFSLTFTWLGLILTSSIIWFLIEAISYFNYKKCGKPIYGLSMLSAAAALYLDAAGDIFGFFATLEWYDQAIHFIGGAAAGGIIFSVIKAMDARGHIRLTLIQCGFFSWMTASFLGVVYELEEYFEDIISGSRRLGDGYDTANDLLLNLLGALFIISIRILNAYVYRRGRASY